jgi:hypothetical protein
MMEEVAQALARLGQRERFTGARELVLCDEVGRHLVYKSLRDRYKAALEGAELRDLRFHDLRHTFGTHAIRHADPREVMEWMGHADLATTQKYLAYKPRGDAARRLSAAFRGDAGVPRREPDHGAPARADPRRSASGPRRGLRRHPRAVRPPINKPDTEEAAH